MFDEKEYIEVFSKVTASPQIRQEVMNMGNRRNARHSGLGRRIAVLAAAVMLLTAMTVTAFAAEDIALWFRSYFEKRNEAPLSEKQVEILEENEQRIGQSITHDGWTIELLSAVHDEATGYVVFRITMPEAVDDSTNWVPGNFSMYGQESQQDFRFLTASPGVFLSGWGTGWDQYEENDHVRNLVVRLTANRERSTVDPFGEEAEYYFKIDNIARDIKGENGEYTAEILAEGLWEFTVSFADPEKSGSEQVELLREPVATQAKILRGAGDDSEDIQGEVMLHSVVMRHLSVTFCYADCDGAPDFTLGWLDDPGSGEMEKAMPAVVMKDGTEIMLLCIRASDLGSITMDAESPIVFEEVSHIRMADGTVIPMPEAE